MLKHQKRLNSCATEDIGVETEGLRAKLSCSVQGVSFVTPRASISLAAVLTELSSDTFPCSAERIGRSIVIVQNKNRHSDRAATTT